MSQVTATLSSATAVELINGRHKWSADEPIEVRGTDTGPNPYELLLNSLAACRCIAQAFYCRHKGLALESGTASYELTRIHAKDCDDPATGFIEKMLSRIHISGDFDEVQRKRLAAISERCPVHKTLANGVVFSDSATFG